MAGTSEKMLEHLLETALDNNKIDDQHSNVPGTLYDLFLLYQAWFDRLRHSR